MIFDVVGRWLDESFADRRIDHHATMVDGDRVMVWYTQYGRHIGNGFPRMRGHAVTGAQVSWPQLHVFRVQDGKVVEHWAIRDDYAMIEQLSPSDECRPADTSSEQRVHEPPGPGGRRPRALSGIRR